MRIRFNPFLLAPTYVSSFDYRSWLQKIEPFSLSADYMEDWQRLKGIVESMERTEILSATEDYLHSVHRTKLCRFRDYLEFSLNLEENLIHVCSYSRFCILWDINTKRRRINSIRRQFQNAQ